MSSNENMNDKHQVDKRRKVYQSLYENIKIFIFKNYAQRIQKYGV